MPFSLKMLDWCKHCEKETLFLGYKVIFALFLAVVSIDVLVCFISLMMEFMDPKSVY